MQVFALILENEKDIIDEYLKSGSERAATTFVRLHQKFVYSTALRYLQNYDDADDIAQEVFIKALTNLKDFKGNSSLKTWLYRITVNMCLNVKKKKSFLSFFSSSSKEESFFDIEEKSLNPHDKLENKEFELKFHKALSELPEKQRETFALKYFDDMTYEEISQMIGTSVGGLKANYFQAVKKLSTLLKIN